MRPNIAVLVLLALPTAALAGPNSLRVTSPAFVANGEIPAEYTCEGANHSPPLAWSRVPQQTKTFAIVVQDVDSGHGNITHWIVTELAPTTTSLEASAKLPAGAVVGQNQQGDSAYMGPCPPTGRHHYIFHVYALDSSLGSDQLDVGAFLQKANGHVLAEGTLTGTYQKHD